MGHQRLLQTRFSYYVSLRFEFRALMTVTISAYKTMIDSSFDRVICGRALVLFTSFMFVCVQCCPTPIPLCFCFVCLRLVYPMLPVSLDCQILISPFVFWNVFSAFGTAVISHFCQKIMHKFLITPLSSYQQFCDLVPQTTGAGLNFIL